MRRIEKIVFNLRLREPARAYLRNCIVSPSTPDGLLKKRCIQFLDPRLGVQLLIPYWLGTFATIVSSDPRTVFVFAFPSPVQLTFEDMTGKPTTAAMYAPHFLVVRETGIVAIRATRRAAFLVAMKKSPAQFFRDSEGRMHCRSAERYFAEMGLGHELMDEVCASRELAENCRFLERYRRPACLPLDPDTASRMVNLVERRRLIAFHELLREEFTADEIFKAIAGSLVYVDLSRDLLDVSASLNVYADESTYQALHEVAAEFLQPPVPYPGFRMQPGTEIDYDGQRYVVVLPGDRDVAVRDSTGRHSVMQLADLQLLKREGLLKLSESHDGRIGTALSRCSKNELARAVAAHDELKSWKAGKKVQHADRTMRRRQAKIQSARNSAEAILLLVDEIRKRGNRNDRLTPCQERVLKRSISTFYNRPSKPTRKGAFSAYVKLCLRIKDKVLESPVRHVSQPTFNKRCALPENNTRRQGRSDKYQVRSVVPSTDPTLTFHGVRPHEVCYVDHTTLPVVLVTPDRRTKLNKPTLTLAYDASVKRERAMVLTWQAPSIFIVMLLIRDYVRRNKCLPRVLTFDHGAELLSEDVREFCRLYQIGIYYRKTGEPRNGAPIESRFAAAMEEIIANIKGNSLSFRVDVRMVDKAMDPFQNDSPEWTLAALYGALEWYFFEHHSKIIVDPDFGITPAEYEEKRSLETGSRDMIESVDVDGNLLLATSPHPHRKWYRSIDSQRGVYEGGRWHWNESFAALGGKSTEVRLELWWDRLIYCQIGNKWVPAISKSYIREPFETAHEASVYARCARSVSKLLAKRSRTMPETLSRLAEAYDPKSFDARLHAQTDETIYLYRRLGLTTFAVPLGDEQEKMGLAFMDVASGREADGVQVPPVSNDQNDHSEPTRAARQGEEYWEAAANDALGQVDAEDDGDDDQDGTLELRDFF